MRTVTAIAISIPLLLFATLARADSNANLAREHYRKGTVHFNLQRYLDAAKEYEAAYELREDPLLLFNIAQAYRLGGDAQKALGAYRSYLRNATNPPNRADVLQRIEELQKIVEVQKRSREAPPMGTLGNAPEPTEPSQPEPVKPTPTQPQPQAEPQPQPQQPKVDYVAQQRSGRMLFNAGIGLTAGGAAVIIFGGALTGVAISNRDAINNAAPGTTFDPGAESNAKAMGPAGVALIAVGAVAAVSGVALLVVGKRRMRAANATLLPAVSPSGVSVSLGGRF